MVKIVVHDRAWFAVSGLSDECVAELQKEFTYPNPQIGMMVAMGRPIWHMPREIRTWKVKDDVFSFPRGGLSRVQSILDANDVVHAEVDDRWDGGECDFPKYVGYDMRPYQAEMVAVGIAKQTCILRAGTGSGKTECALYMLAQIGRNALVVLPTKGLFEQWMARIERSFGVSGSELGVIQGKTKRLRPITLAMQATLARGVAPEIRNFFGVVLVDETQRSASKSMVSIVDQMPARYRIGVSASEKRKDRLECLVYDLFGPVAYEAKRDDLTAQGHILDVEIRIVFTDFKADWYGFGGEIDFNKLLSEMVDDDARNMVALKIAEEEIVAGEQVIVLSHRREHVKSLQRYFIARSIPSGQLIGDGGAGDADEFLRAKEGLENGSISVGVGTYGALGYGIDLPAVSVGIAVTPIAANEQQFNQVRGRLCRTNPKTGKTKGRLYVLADLAIHGDKHVKNMIAWNPTVVVRVDGKWVPARQWIASRRATKSRFKTKTSREQPTTRHNSEPKMRKRSAVAPSLTTTSTTAQDAPKTSAEERTLPLLPGNGAATWYCTLCQEQFPYTDCSKREDGGIECPVCAGPAKPLHAASTAVRDALDAKANGTNGTAATGTPEPAKQAPPQGLQTRAQKQASQTIPTSTRVDADPSPTVPVVNPTGLKIEGTKIFIPWGKARMPVDRYNSFECGGGSVTVDVPAGADRNVVIDEALDLVAAVAEKLYQRQLAWYKSKLDGGVLYKD